MSDGCSIVSVGTHKQFYEQHKAVKVLQKAPCSELLKTDCTCFRTDFAVFKILKNVIKKLLPSRLIGT